MKYKIEVEEILQDVFAIDATDIQDALDKAQRMYYQNTIYLGPEDLKEVNFRKYED